MSQQSRKKLRKLINACIIAESGSGFKGVKFGKLIRDEADATISDEEKILGLFDDATKTKYTLQDFYLDWYTQDGEELPVTIDLEKILKDTSDTDPGDYRKGTSKKRYDYFTALKGGADWFTKQLKKTTFQEPIAGVDRGSQHLPKIVRSFAKMIKNSMEDYDVIVNMEFDSEEAMAGLKASMSFNLPGGRITAFLTEPTATGQFNIGSDTRTMKAKRRGGGGKMFDKGRAWHSSDHGQKTPRGIHRGIDVHAPLDTPIGAYINGYVLFAENEGGRGGNVIILATAYPTKPNETNPKLSIFPAGTEFIRFAHLNSISVKAGSVVNAGELIGTVGKTGTDASDTHPHIHLSVSGTDNKGRYSYKIGNRDPFKLFDQSGWITDRSDPRIPKLPKDAKEREREYDKKVAEKKRKRREAQLAAEKEKEEKSLKEAFINTAQAKAFLVDELEKAKADVISYIDDPARGGDTFRRRLDDKLEKLSMEKLSDTQIQDLKDYIANIRMRVTKLPSDRSAQWMGGNPGIMEIKPYHILGSPKEDVIDTIYHELYHALDTIMGDMYSRLKSSQEWAIGSSKEDLKKELERFRQSGHKKISRMTDLFKDEIKCLMQPIHKSSWTKRANSLFGVLHLPFANTYNTILKEEMHVYVAVQQIRKEFPGKTLSEICMLSKSELIKLSFWAKVFLASFPCSKAADSCFDKIASYDSKEKPATRFAERKVMLTGSEIDEIIHEAISEFKQNN